MTLKEAVAAANRGKEPPRIPYVYGAQYSIAEASSVVNGGIKTMKGGISRASYYSTGSGDNAKPAFPKENHVWRFDFHDGSRLETNDAKQADIPKVEQKIRQLCGEVRQKQIGAVALLLSQSGMAPLAGSPLAKYGVAAHELTGANMLLNRDLTTGLYTLPVFGTTGHDLFHDVQISPDGKTATITQTISGDLNASDAVDAQAVYFGKATISQRLVIDLEPEIPVVTGCQLSQRIEA